MMATINLLPLILHLPINERFTVVEQTLKSIKQEEFKNKMELAAATLYSDYINDKELTAFTSLDYENFYETK
ncbi:MAG: hypothetical protein LBN27_13825 [Prevotellaceae bacterium]|jgi:hypothetical protein|nr:hypothetical protein [Prevotellaceae bacterium]